MKIFVLQDNVFALLVFVAFDDLVPGDFLAVFFGNALVVDWTQVFRPQKPELEFLLSRGGMKRDRDVNQTKTDTALPNCSHN